MSQPSEPLYAVIVNEADQYSVWPAERPLPPGWRNEGTRDTREACLEQLRREHARAPGIHSHEAASRWSSAAT